jgi:Dolichyl-phosphate-mannose-protein mannosyltransferase
LDQRLLWVDEAETALLARNILVYGIPKAYDGKTLISQELGHEFGSNYIWRWTPWLEKYVTAGSFALIGQSTFSARLPFAILGLISVISMYPLALSLFRDRWVGIFSMAFLSLAVPFLLHVRQCRYYSLLILASIWVIYFFIGIVEGKRGAVMGLAAAMTVLFHSNNLSFLATGIALAPCLFIFRFDRPALRRLALATLIVVAFNGPWAYFFLLRKTEETGYPFFWKLSFYLETTNRYTFPLAAVVLFLGICWHLGRKRFPISSRDWRSFIGLIVMAAVYIVVLSTGPWSFYRYSLGLLPICATLLAFMSWKILKWNSLVGVLFTIAFLFTAVFHQISASLFKGPKFNLRTAGRSFPVCDRFLPLGNYLYELAKPFNGPMDNLVKYLLQNGRPGDRIFISYGDLILKFYTKYEVRGGQTGEDLRGWVVPEWVINRSFFRLKGGRPALDADADKMRSWVNTLPADYRGVATPWPDLPYDDIPEPEFHWFRPPEDGDKMKIYRRAVNKP